MSARASSSASRRQQRVDIQQSAVVGAGGLDVDVFLHPPEDRAEARIDSECREYGIAFTRGDRGAMRQCRYLPAGNHRGPYLGRLGAKSRGSILTAGLNALGLDHVRSMAASVPLKRLGTAEDVAYAAQFLASQEAAYKTGQTIIVDGGQILPETFDALPQA